MRAQALKRPFLWRVLPHMAWKSPSYSVLPLCMYQLDTCRLPLKNCNPKKETLNDE
jgi:hypothetical protein